MNHDLSETLNSLHDMKPFVIIMWVWLSPQKAKLAKLDNLQIMRWEVVLIINNLHTCWWQQFLLLRNVAGVEDGEAENVESAFEGILINFTATKNKL